MVAKSADEARAQAAAAQAKATADKAAAAKAEAAKTEAAKVAAAKKAAADKKAAAKTAEEKKAAAEEEAEAKRKEDAYIASFENPITSQYDPRIYENAGLDPERVGVMTSNVTINNAATDPAAIAKAQAEQEGVETAYKYGISEALFNDPEYGEELKAVYTLFKAGNTGKALEELFKTKYYTTLNATVKKRMKERLEQPDVYKDSLDKYKVASRKRLVDAGIKIKMTDFDKLASQAYERGLDDNQFDELIKFSGKITGFGGDILGDTSDLKTYANSFGVSKYLGQAYWDQKSKDLFTGTNTLEDIQAEIRATAASAFPGYADQIKNGMSVESIASAYKGAMANVLERDADSITFEDQTLRSALQYVGPDGKPAIKPLWQFEKELRSKPEWEYTNNARDTIDSLSLKVLRDWGLA